MKKLVHLFSATLVVVFFLGAVPRAHAQDKPKTVSVTGEVIDMNCYMSGGAKGPSHQQCAQKCIDGGGPVGLLTSDDKVVLLMPDENKGDAFKQVKGMASKTVTVSGEMYMRGGASG